MIIIEITDPEAIMKKHAGWFTGLIGGIGATFGMINLGEKVQENIVERLTSELGEANIRIEVREPSEETGLV